jgi:hypothetical protein
MAIDLHPDMAVLAPLLGTWQGPGAGEYPTIEPFGYLESVTFHHVGKPFFGYQQRTRGAHHGLPMHAECGYWRSAGPGRVEVVLAHPTGVAEILEGTIDDAEGRLVIDLRSTSVGTSSTAKTVDATERTFELDGDELRYTFRMSAVGQPLQHHLSAVLSRAPSS